MYGKQFRIGNLVNYKIVDELDERKEWFEQCEIDADDLVYLSLENADKEDYQPITLTEEWLLKFGFKWSIQHQALKLIGFNYVIDFYKSHPQYQNEVCFLNKSHRTGETLICVQYVHQLQNLYFALTGQELTLKQ